MFITTFFFKFMRALSNKNEVNIVRQCKFYLYSIYICTAICLDTPSYGSSQTIVPLNRNWVSLLPFPSSNDGRRCSRFILEPKVLVYVFIYSISEQRYGHNLQLRVGCIPPRDKDRHKINRNNNKNKTTFRPTLSRKMFQNIVTDCYSFPSKT